MAKQWKQSLTAAEVQAEAEDALEKDISQMSPATNSVAANLDGGVAAVDWSSKTLKTAQQDVFSSLSVTGSGYIMSITIADDGASSDIEVKLTIDGTNKGRVITGHAGSSGDINNSVTLMTRFDLGFDVSQTNNNTGDSQIHINYVLD